MKYDVHLENAVAPRPLAVVQRRASLPQLPKVIPEACGIVWKVVRAQQITGAGRHVALYLDDQINLEVGVELEAPLSAGFGEVVGSALPAGQVATAVHTSARITSCPARTTQSVIGARLTATHWPGPIGRFTVIGWTHGTATLPRSAPIFSIFFDDVNMATLS